MKNNRFKFDMISIGDATLDTFFKLQEALLIPMYEEHNPMLCLPYADKMPIEEFSQKIAGNALNNAVGSSRLGMRSAFYSILGNDDSGKKILAGIKKEGVSTKYVQIDKTKPTNFTAVLNYEGERTQLIYRVDRKYSLPKLETSKWVYYTAVGKNHVNMESEIVEYIKKTGTQLGFNPGAYQLKRGAESLKEVLLNTHVLFVNKEESYKLVGRGEVNVLLRQLHKIGPKIVVVTDGSKGAYSFDGKDMYHMPVFPIKIVEMTGAGDSFATAFIGALHYDKDIKEALRWGTANSTSVVLQVGPQDGLLNRAGIEKILKKHAKVKPIKIK